MEVLLGKKAESESLRIFPLFKLMSSLAESPDVTGVQSEGRWDIKGGYLVRALRRFCSGLSLSLWILKTIYMLMTLKSKSSTQNPSLEPQSYPCSARVEPWCEYYPTSLMVWLIGTEN